MTPAIKGLQEDRIGGRDGTIFDLGKLSQPVEVHPALLCIMSKQQPLRKEASSTVLWASLSWPTVFQTDGAAHHSWPAPS